MSPDDDTPARPGLAVALAFEPGKDHAPRVVATGRGALAAAIIATAEAHGVAIEQDPDLATALATVPIDAEIPEELYRAVAVVIGFVLQRGKRAG
jgi:flagellar biosynthesis protein